MRNHLLLIFGTSSLLRWNEVLSSWSSEELAFYDDLRTLQTWDTDKDNTSNVVEVTGPSNIRGSNRTNEEYRLCHLPVILPLTDGDGNARFGEGIFPTAAAMLAMLHFNERNDSVVKDLQSDSILRNCDVRFTMGFHDSMFSPIDTSRILLEDLLAVDHSLATPKPCAIVGTFRSAVTGPLAIMASVNDVPVISSVATSSQLDMKSTYGLLGRTIPSDAGAAVAVAQYLREELNVTHCGVIYVRDEFGTSYSSDFTSAAFALDPPMVIKSVPLEISGDTLNSIQVAVDQLAETGYNYFLAITNPKLHDKVIRRAKDAGIIGPGKFWVLAEGAVFSDGFSYNARTQKKLALASSGMGLVQPVTERNDAFENAWLQWNEDASLMQYFRSKMPEYINLTNLQFDSPTFWDYVAYDAVMALGIAACQTEERYFHGTSLFQNILGLSFQGASGNVTLDPQTGTRDTSQMSYTMTILNANPAKGGEITFNRTVVARLATPGDATLNSGNVQRKWIKIERTVYAHGNTSAPPVLPPIQEEYNLIRTSVMGAGLGLAAIVMVLSIFWMTWTIVFRRSQVVHKSHKESLMMLCLGSFVMACAVIPMSFQEPMSERSLDIACMSIPWLFQVGFVLAFSALASKTSINNSIYTKAQQFMKSRRRLQKANASRAVIPFAVISSINVTLLIVWTVVSPSQWKRSATGSTDIYGRPIESYGNCESPADGIFHKIFLAIDTSLLIIAIFLYYKARRVASIFNENFYILISMSTILQAFAVGAPSLVLASTPEAQFLTRSVLVTVIGFAVLLPMFVPKEIARKKEIIIRARRNSSIDSRFKLQDAWNHLSNSSSRVRGLSKRSRPDFFSSVIYETGEGSQNPQESETEDCFASSGWTQGLDALAL